MAVHRGGRGPGHLSRISGGAGGAGGGGPVLDNSIAAPVLSLAVPANQYPPELYIALPADYQVGVHQLRFRGDDDYLLGSPFINDLLSINDSEAAAQSKIDASLAAITTGTNFFDARIEWSVGAVTHYTNWSNTQGHGDVTAPTITSSTTPSAPELSPVLITITASEVCNFALSGADAALLELIGAQPASSIQLRLLANAIPNFEPPGKSSYAFNITPTDLSSNAGSATAHTLTITDVDELASAFSFTDISGATNSTVYTSNTITVAGLAAGVSAPIAITGGTYSKNGGAYTSAAGSVVNGDTFTARITSSSSDATGVSATVTIGDVPANQVSDTYTVTTGSSFNPATLFGASEYGYAFDPTDTSKVWQNIDGTGAGASGQPIGRIVDIASGASRHFNAAANDTTRPTLTDIGSGIFAMQFDGTNDDLKLALAGLYAAGAATIIMAVKNTATAQSSRYIWMEGSSGSDTPVYLPNSAIGTTAQARLNKITLDNGTNLINTNGGTIHYDGTWEVITLTDSGSVLSLQKNRGAASTNAYTRSGTITLNQSSLGARLGASGGNYANFLIGRLVAIGRTLSGTEQANAEAWCAAPYGISLP